MQNLFISVTGNQITVFFLAYLFSILYGIYLLVRLETTNVNKGILFFALFIPLFGIGLLLLRKNGGSKE